jgi:hypothetical protein
VPSSAQLLARAAIGVLEHGLQLGAGVGGSLHWPRVELEGQYVRLQGVRNGVLSE